MQKPRLSEEHCDEKDHNRNNARKQLRLVKGVRSKSKQLLKKRVNLKDIVILLKNATEQLQELKKTLDNLIAFYETLSKRLLPSLLKKENNIRKIETNYCTKAYMSTTMFNPLRFDDADPHEDEGVSEIYKKLEESIERQNLTGKIKSCAIHLLNALMYGTDNIYRPGSRYVTNSVLRSQAKALESMKRTYDKNCVYSQITTFGDSSIFDMRFIGTDEYILKTLDIETLTRCLTHTYPFSLVVRTPVHKRHLSWEVSHAYYKPEYYESLRIAEIYGFTIHPCYKEIRSTDKGLAYVWNSKYIVRFGNKEFVNDTKSYIEDSCTVRLYALTEGNAGVPMNPVCRTGIIGKGELPFWGPNRLYSMVIWQWNKVAKRCELILMQDNNFYTLPKGFSALCTCSIMAAQNIHWDMKCFPKRLKEIWEDTLEKLCNKEGTEKKTLLLKNKLSELFKNIRTHGEEICGYVDHPLNTDNAWVELTVHFYRMDQNKQLKGECIAGNIADRDDQCKFIWFPVMDALFSVPVIDHQILRYGCINGIMLL